MVSSGIIISAIVSFAFVFVVITIIRFCYASKCTKIDIKSGSSSISVKRDTGEELKDIQVDLPIHMNKV